MNNTSNKKLLITVLLVVAAAAALAFILIKGNVGQESNTVLIKNLGSCSKNINRQVVDEVQRSTYALVKSANDYNKKDSSSKYTATIRNGFCKQVSENNFPGYSGESINVKTNSILIDIPDAKQSWFISYDWVDGTGKIDTDLGTIKPSCVSDDQLVYGDFKCANILNLAKYGTDKIDPILEYMPYSGAGFRMEYDANTKTVSVSFQPPAGTTDIPEFIENTKAIIPYWFQKRGLDQSKYTVVYSSDIDGNENQENNN